MEAVAVCECATRAGFPPIVRLQKRFSEPAIDATQNETANLNQWCTDFAPRGTRYALSMVRNRADADEIMQEAMYRMVSNSAVREDGQAEDQLTARFFTIIRNLCIDLIRERKRKPVLGGDAVAGLVDPRGSRSVGGEQAVDRLNRCVEAAMQRLPENRREALNLKVQSGLSYAAIAEVLNTSHARVRTWIYRARKQLARELKQEGWLS